MTYHDYLIPALENICKQLVASDDPNRMLDCADKAEDVLVTTEPSGLYRVASVCQDISTTLPEEIDDALTVSGEAIQHDLRRLTEDLSDRADIRVEDSIEPVFTQQELARHWNVSVKTLRRWRDLGLVGRRFRFGNRKRIAYPRRTVLRFQQRFPDRVRRAGAMARLSKTQKNELVENATRLATAGVSRQDIVRSLANEYACCIESVRKTLKKSDFDSVYAELQSPQGSNRSIDQRRKRVMELDLDFIASDEFNRSDRNELLGPGPANAADTKTKAPKDAGPLIARLYGVPLLTAEQERFLFRKYNYLKFLASQLRETLSSDDSDASQLDTIESYYQQAVDVRARLIESNLRLVVANAKRFIREDTTLSELISEGNMALMRAIEKFDYSRGFKFSTYATWAIRRDFAAQYTQMVQRRERFHSGQDQAVSQQCDDRANVQSAESDQARRRQEVNRLMGGLDERERKIISLRFGLDYRTEPLTLKEIGNNLGVSKERIRQLEMRAMKKLRRHQSEMLAA